MTITDYSFFLSVLTLIRFIGGVVFLDFYFKYRNRRFLLLTLAFVLFSLTPAIQMFLPDLEVLINEQTHLRTVSKLFFILSETLTTICVLFFTIIIINYITTVKTSIAVTVTIIVLMIPFIFFPFLNFEESFYLTQILDLIIILFVMSFIFYHRKQFADIARNVPLFFLINIVVVISNLLLTLFESPAGDFELLTRIGMTFIVPFTFIHLEYNLLGKQKATLKDKYTHNLSQFLQIVSGRFFVISNFEMNEDIKKEFNNLQKDYNDISELITLIRKI